MAGDITVPRAARIVRIISDIALALYTFFLPWPHTPALKSILFGAAVVSWLVGSFVQGKKLLRRSPLDWYIAAVTITVLLSCLFSISPSYSFNNLQSEFLWHLGLYFLLIFSIDDVSRLKILMVALLLSVTVITGYGVYGYLHNTGVKVDGLVGARATSVLPSFGRVAFYISLAFPIIFSWFLHERRRWLLWILGLSSGLTILFLILTFARGSWLSIFLAIGLLSTLRDRRILALLLVAIIISPLFMPDNVMQRGASFFYMRHYRTSAIMGDRYWLWVSALEMIDDHPWFGMGYGGKIFARAYPDYIQPNATGDVMENAHNLYLQLAVERGIIGALALMVLFARVLTYGITRLKAVSDEQLRGLLLGCLTSFAVFFIYGMTTYRYENEIGLLLWLLIAIIVIIGRTTANGGIDVRKR